jgi:hypothetical protein
MSVHKLITRPAAISAETVELLESFLQMAKKGEITAVALASVQPDGTGVHEATSSDQQLLLLGSVTRLLHRMHINADEGME